VRFHQQLAHEGEIAASAGFDETAHARVFGDHVAGAARHHGG